MNMPVQGSLVLNLVVTDPRLDDEEREAVVIELVRQLRAADGDLGEVRRTQAVAPPGAKSGMATALAALTAILSATSLKSFFDYLIERWRGREITIEVEANGRKVKLTARTVEEMVVAYNAAAALLSERK